MAYIATLPDEPATITRGVFMAPYDTGWRAVLELEGEVYDLGMFGNFAEAGEAYLKTKHLLEGTG